jgi:hypothetical protein
MNKVISIQQITRKDALTVVGGLSTPSKMPCLSYSTPVVACNVGSKMARMPGSVCSECYAMKGFYAMYANHIEPVQHARYEAMLYDPAWVEAMVTLLLQEQHFRWFDAGDLPSLAAFERIVEVCKGTPGCTHWLPTREYGVIGDFVKRHGKDALPDNLIIRLSAMYPDRPAVVPASLQNTKNLLVGNVHTKGATPTGYVCPAPTRNNKCGTCRACWSKDVPAVSYVKH